MRKSEDAASPRSTRPVNKKSWATKVNELIGKLFRVARDILGLIGNVFQEILRTAVHGFAVLFGVTVNPFAYLAASVLVFAAILWVTFQQWLHMGAWIARVAHFPTVTGIALSVVVGILINLVETAPNLWKLTRQMASTFSDLGINPEYSPDSNNPGETHRNWYNLNYSTAKFWSGIAFLAELMIISFYLVASRQINLYAVLLAAVSLRGPDAGLLWTAHSISLFGEVSNRAAEKDEPNTRL